MTMSSREEVGSRLSYSATRVRSNFQVIGWILKQREDRCRLCLSHACVEDERVTRLPFEDARISMGLESMVKGTSVEG